MKAVLIIWIGFAQSQTLSTTVFDSMAECVAAAEAIANWDHRLGGECVPYQVEMEALQ